MCECDRAERDHHQEQSLSTTKFSTLSLIALQLQNRDRNRQERRYPDNGGQESHVHFRFVDGPASAQDGSQRTGCHGQGKALSDESETNQFPILLR